MAVPDLPKVPLQGLWEDPRRIAAASRSAPSVPAGSVSGDVRNDKVD